MVYTLSTAFAIYFVLWWIVLFLTLPFGVRSQHEGGEGTAPAIPGTDPGAPIASQMGRKLIWTTAISAVIFAVAWLAYNAGYLNVERLSKLMGFPL
jgi:predicted secreted protein